MTVLVLVSLLAAAPPPAQSMPDAEWAVEVPRLDGLGGLAAFFERAGEKAALLRPAAWRGDFHPLLRADPLDRASLELHGIDPAGPATLSARGRARATCVRLREPARFEELAGRALSGLGDPWKGSSSSGARLVGARSGGVLVGGYALRGQSACAVRSPKDGEALLRALAGRLGAVPAASTGALLWTPRGRATLEGSASALRAQGELAEQVSGLRSQPLPAALKALAPGGLLFVRGTAEVKPFLRRIEHTFLRMCGACPLPATRALLERLSAAASGAYVWRVGHLKPQPDLATPAGRLRSLSHAAVFALRDRKRAHDALAELLPKLGGSTDGKGWKLPVDGGELAILETGDLLWVSTDAEALQGLQLRAEAEARTGDTPAPLYARVGGREAAAALGRLSLFELLRNPELAPLVLASTELEPLLDETLAVEGTLRPTQTGTRFGFVWQLVDPPSP